jgi:mRNA interferase HigB
MKLISNSALVNFAAKHPESETVLQAWRKVIEKNGFQNWSELKNTFNSVDKVNELAVFDVGGNKYRIIAFVRFAKQIIYIKHVLTHNQYDKGQWKNEQH